MDRISHKQITELSDESLELFIVEMGCRSVDWQFAVAERDSRQNKAIHGLLLKLTERKPASK